MNNHKNSHRVIALGAALVCVSGVLSAAESVPLPEPPKGWETTAAAAVTLTRGNSETFLGTLSLDTKRKWEKDEALFGVSGGYGNAKVNGATTKNTEFIQAFGQYNHLFTER